MVCMFCAWFPGFVDIAHVDGVRFGAQLYAVTNGKIMMQSFLQYVLYYIDMLHIRAYVVHDHARTRQSFLLREKSGLCMHIFCLFWQKTQKVQTK